MKKSLFLFLFVPLYSAGQVFIDFESEDLTRWEQSRKFSWDTTAVNSLSGNFSLHHTYDNQESGHDQISFSLDSLKLDSADTKWQFLARHGYAPSSSNNWCVFIVSDIDARDMHPKGKVNGYAVGVNYYGSDDLLKLWKVKAGIAVPVITSSFNWQESVGDSLCAGVVVTRTASGLWKLYAGIRGDFNDPGEIGQGFDNEILDMHHAGIYFEYSSKQDMQLWLDDLMITGFFLTDTIPPGIKAIKVIGARDLEIIFSEPVIEDIACDTAHYNVDHSVGYPETVCLKNETEALLRFRNEFPSGQPSTLEIRDISDRKGNVCSNILISFIYYKPVKNDVVFTEIMADPLPSAGLPEYEYIELYNRTNFEIGLENWLLECGQLNKTLTDHIIKPYNYVLLIHEDAIEDYENFGECIPLFSSKTSLPNSSGTIVLRDQFGQQINWMEYDLEWHGNDYFAEGGWSLEIIDPERFCGGKENWITSSDRKGGTPGRRNSNYGNNPDTLRPEITEVAIIEDGAIEVLFSEPMDSISLINPVNYSIGEGVYPEIVEVRGSGCTSVILWPAGELYPDSLYYMRISEQLKDCSGNHLQADGPFRFALPGLPEPADILISEILFNPLPGGTDFVELYNPTRKTFDLFNLLLANRNESGELSSFTRISGEHKLYFPDEFLLLTEDFNRLMAVYHGNIGGTVIEVRNFPGFDDDAGTVVLTDRWIQIIDEFSYKEGMHSYLLSSAEGVSLERISYRRETNDPDNWHSAAETDGFATPGCENSQYLETGLNNPGIQIEPGIFTPNNDGNNDYAGICYAFNRPGFIANIIIFDPMGRIIRNLSNSRMLGTTGCINWDGSDDLGRRVRMGIYLIYIELYDTDGHMYHIKKTVVVSARKSY